MQIGAIALAVAASIATGCNGAPKAPMPEAGPKRLHLFFTGNVHGEVEPCG